MSYRKEHEILQLMGKLRDCFPLIPNREKNQTDLLSTMENVTKNLMEHGIFAKYKIKYDHSLEKYPQ